MQRSKFLRSQPLLNEFLTAGNHYLEAVTIRMHNALPNPPLYYAYLVRLWRETPDTPWRASAQSVQSGETVRFGSLQALYAFLDAETGGGGCTQPPPVSAEPPPDP